MGKSVLIVDDQYAIKQAIKHVITNQDYVIAGQTTSGKRAIELAKDLNPDYITLDIVLPDMPGLDVLQELKQAVPKSKIILVSGVDNTHVIQEGMKLGANAYIIKPFTPDELVNALAD